MNLRRSLFLLSVLAMIVGPSAAALKEEVYCSTIPYSEITYHTNHTLPLFDSSKGILVRVDLNLTVNGTQFVNFTCLSSGYTGNVTTTTFFHDIVTMMDGSKLEAEVTDTTIHYVSGAGNPPLGIPPSGFNYTLTGNNYTSTYYVNCENLQNFTSTTPGEDKSYPVSSDGSGEWSGPASAILIVETYADSVMCIKYTYDDSKLNITKTANTSGPSGVGEIIDYEIEVCNPATVNVSNITVRDSLLSGSPFSIGTLSPGHCGNVTADLNYTVSPNDVCRGWINNTANATGDAECGYFIDTDKNATWNVSTTYNSSINITKTANTTGPLGLEEVVEYYIRVCNTGDVTVTNLTVNDSLTGGPYNIGTLDPGQCANVTPNPKYTVTVNNVCRGWVNNTASSAGIDYCGDPVKTEANATLNVTASYNASINITKTANTSGPVSPNEDIEYSIRVCNTGNTTIYNLTIIDNRTGIRDIGTLNVSECKSWYPIYTVTEQDICNGSVVNSANAIGVDICGRPIRAGPAQAEVATKYDASISIAKGTNTTGPVSPDEEIEYTITVCNTGTLTVRNVTVHDNRTGDHPIGTINVSQCVPITAIYTVTELDICNGSVNNSAYAIGNDYCGKPVGAGPAWSNVSTEYNSSMSIAKIANTTGPVSPDEEIEYTITVCNTGNLTIYNVTVHDNRTGDHPIGTIDVSQCVPVKAIYTVTELDICNGSLNNSAYATGYDYCGKPVGAGPAWSKLSTEYNSSMSIAKIANTSGPVSPDEDIEYTITVCNTGNLTIYNVTVHDNRTGDHPIGTIDVGQCVPVKAIYAVTEIDICNGSVNNSANATGIDYCGTPVSADLTWSNVFTEYNSSMSIAKVANTSGPVSLDEEIEYAITVCNTGNLTLYNVTVIDNRTGGYSVAKLEKGECNVTRRTYVVVREDLCKPIVNIVVAEATDACGGPVNANDSAEVDTVCYHCISGSKYWDKNGNGFRDDNDPPLENWTIFVDLNDSGILDPGEPSATTDVDGHWQICDLIPGAYNVSEVILEGWGPTDPPRGYHDPVNVTTENLTGIDFLNTGIYCISGHKRWDRDGDGVADPTDEPLENWTIFIDEDGDRTADPREPVTTTGGDGFWKICNLPPGSYTVCEEMKSDWIQTCPRVSDCYSVEIVNRSAMSLEFLNYKHERQNENFIRLGDQSALAWDMSYVDGLAKNKIDIDKTQTQREGCSGTDLFNFGNITVDDQVANSTGPGTSGNEIKIVTSQS